MWLGQTETQRKVFFLATLTVGSNWKPDVCLFDLSYCKECSELLTIISFLEFWFLLCFNVYITTYVTLRLLFNVCVCVTVVFVFLLFCSIHYFYSVIDFVFLAFRSTCLISYRFILLSANYLQSELVAKTNEKRVSPSGTLLRKTKQIHLSRITSSVNATK